MRISTADTVEEIRHALKQAFPDTTFELDAASARRLTWVTVAWSGGPPVAAVGLVTEPFAGMRFQPNAVRRRRRRYVTAVDEDGRRYRKTYEPGLVVLHRRP